VCLAAEADKPTTGAGGVPPPFPCPARWRLPLLPGTIAYKVPETPLPRKLHALVRASGAPVACLLLAGCAAVTPLPRYTGAPQAKVVGELVARQHADRQRLLRVVASYAGVRYQWGGTSRAGMDCSAFARAVFRETYGIELPRTVNQMFVLGQHVERPGALRPGDLVFFRGPRLRKGVAHVGIYVGDGLFAHASSSVGSTTVTAMSDSYFSARYAGGRRIRR
jgi:cell wall-associated NlpC family hydrolase